MADKGRFVTDAGKVVDVDALGSQPVSCLLACDAAFDITTAAVLWDALYDNLWDLNPLASIPDGLGMTFAFDGSSSLVAPTELGIWALSYSGVRAGDPGWVGSFDLGIGVSFPWVQGRTGDGGATTAIGIPDLSASLIVQLPAGAQITHNIATDAPPTSAPSNVNQVYLSIVRLE